jgi:hypothetical protein
LGHLVTDKGIKCDPEKLTAVRDWPVPTSVTEVRSFIGLASYYRRFIPDFGTVAYPMTRLTQKNQRFQWSADCDQAFNKLKDLLTDSPVLSYLEKTGKFVLDTDASLTGIGAVISQIQNGEERVIAYASKTISKSQQNHCTTHRELLAVVAFLKHFQPYLWGRPFTNRTDHASLVWIKNFKEPEGMLARWLTVIDT